MSRIGNKPVEINDKVEISLGDSSITVKGPKGELTQKLLMNELSLNYQKGS